MQAIIAGQGVNLNALSGSRSQGIRGVFAVQIMTYKIHTVLKDISATSEVDEDDDEAFIRSLKIKTLCDLPQHNPRRVTRSAS
jgi:hypothetical protein